tara:strand:- start:1558 stop:2073 length:516 start_codon:yes stop_codon:yes gene_type:complete
MKKIFILFLVFFLNIEKSNAETKIAYININHILNNSIVGQTISEHIQNIKEKKLQEFDKVEKMLSEKESNLINKKNIIDKDEFNNEIEILKKEIVEYRKEKNKFNKEVDQKKIKYTKIVLNTLNPIISKYVEDNSIEIVLSKKNIVIAKKDLDITNPVMDLLNNQLIKIDF